jgi:hypothetical protein
MSKLVWAVAVGCLLTGSAMAEGPIPDLRGTWTGTSESIVYGSGSPQHAGTQSNQPEFRSVAFSLTIDRQEGRRFSGTFSSPKHTETVIAIISRTGVIHMVDDDGIDTVAMLAPDRMEICYQHVAPGSEIVSCTELVKQS